MDNRQTITSFSELTSSELKHISGGDWWTDFLREIRIRGIGRADSDNKHKIS
ncbi:ComC/BlpC family leader-containing pheromone/bacteriocin [Streptococcus acidominimus]|uniref:ComC/BlpC family peptide pheromone/bacteriocin n=1 Tax=Streptococcus acidominimus TaxID=1326 RepID=A0A380IEG2_STRAI|nr:ComC/BlpC family leader-containing pheromone/bacteriocin [Streptococcus acidominimus]MBF0848446.1 ComC/BlpC family leader-containing pheromone/bacteriocin [Streptococcus danieliae]MBF0818199.1 ComC/BlpC family leader-containing pheromone/bacteriocin [Streptococcus acidominimus]MBF0838516.1 ComC/BlpC family leader-containing pheromone/bacteriocin [Streptococcus acidominimus]TFU31503.1 ComC/BlpC family peptide pheromone/bacteriocin [Streptococcus acidominimus]SUN07195.1 double glycine cleavag